MNYSERLLALLPEPLRVAFFVCSGSEANDLALRLARAYTGQQDVIVIDGEYHGNTTATYEISTSLLDNPAEGKAAREFIHLAAQPNLFRGPHRGVEAGATYAGSVRECVERIQHKDRQPAAFFTEALLGSSGGIDLPDGYLAAAYQIVREAGGVCIADEVQVGFGRVGAHWWAFEAQGVVPDIVTLGKPMGNGHPLSAVVTTRRIAEAFAAQTTYFNTFGGNPVSCEVGSAVLDVMEREGLRANALEVGRYFKTALLQLMATQPMLGAVYGLGLYMGIELVREHATAEPATEEAMRVADRMKARGIIVYPTGDHYNILKLKPPLVFSKTDADFFVGQLAEVLAGL
jgi:4-aminobutyrate aminotransferase-like enzyme